MKCFLVKLIYFSNIYSHRYILENSVVIFCKLSTKTNEMFFKKIDETLVDVYLAKKVILSSVPFRNHLFIICV